MTDRYDQLRNHWLVAAEANEISKKPIARQILGTPIVLFRGEKGVAALVDRCPHRNAPLSDGKVLEASIQCPYHGWRFDGSGNCTRRPGCQTHGSAKCESFRTQVHDGFVWINMSQTASSGTLPKSKWKDSEFGRFTWQETIEAEFVDAIENLLDATHTPFVHAGLVRSASKGQKFSATIRVQESHVEAEYYDEGKQSGWISWIFERNRASSFGRFIAPCIAELEYTSQQGTEFVLRAYFTPVNEQQVRLYSTFYVRKSRIPFSVKKLLLSPFFSQVLKQDKAILASQQHNVRRFGGPDYQYWEGDLLRGLIENWLTKGHFPTDHPEHTIELEI